MNITRKRLLTAWGRKPPALYMIEVEINEERLVNRLGEQALRNKTRRTRYANGLITATVRPCEGERK